MLYCRERGTPHLTAQFVEGKGTDKFDEQWNREEAKRDLCNLICFAMPLVFLLLFSYLLWRFFLASLLVTFLAIS